MIFFQRQKEARTRTRLLLVLMLLAVLGLIVATNLLYALYGSVRYQQALSSFFTMDTFKVSSALIVSVVMIAGGIKTLILAQGGGRGVAESLGAKVINPSTDNLYERRLLNVVEEMAIASGAPVPAVYILHGEEGINAFAAGFRLHDAVIGMTRGAMEQLSRDELEGVVAHEFSHIVYGDMRLNMRLIGIIFGITMLADLGYAMLRSATLSRSKSSHFLFVTGLGLMVIGYSGAFFGSLIRSSVSRTREYLADASAVQYTRDNKGLANALKKIGGSIFGSRLDSASAPETSHMMFGSSVDRFLTGWFATHPPLDNRIRRLTPRWDGTFIIPEATVVSPQERPGKPGGSGHEGTALIASAASLSESVQSMGAPGKAHRKYARSLVQTLPVRLSKAIYDPEGVQLVLMVLVLDETPSVLKKQCDIIAHSRLPDALNRTLALQEELECAGLLKDRLSILDMALPALKTASRNQQQGLQSMLLKLTRADGKTSVMEWALTTIVHHSLAREQRPEGTIRYEKYRSLKRLNREVGIVVKALVSMSGMALNDKRECYVQTMQSLGLQSVADKEKVNFRVLNGALEKLSLLYSDARKDLLNALCRCIDHDGKVMLAEAQALRAIAVIMECPLPPLVEASSPESPA